MLLRVVMASSIGTLFNPTESYYLLSILPIVESEQPFLLLNIFICSRDSFCLKVYLNAILCLTTPRTCRANIDCRCAHFASASVSNFYIRLQYRRIMRIRRQDTERTNNIRNVKQPIPEPMSATRQAHMRSNHIGKRSQKNAARPGAVKTSTCLAQRQNTIYMLFACSLSILAKRRSLRQSVSRMAFMSAKFKREAHHPVLAWTRRVLVLRQRLATRRSHDLRTTLRTKVLHICIRI